MAIVINGTTGITLDSGSAVTLATAVAQNPATGGTITLSPSSGNYQYITNDGAFTIAAPSGTTDFTLVVLIQNAVGAGAVTLSGFTKVNGDLITTTSTDKFILYVTRVNALTIANVVALQ